MDPLSTNARSSFDAVKAALESFIGRARYYRFEELEQIVQKHGWTLNEYNEQYDMDLTARKLKGHGN